MDIYEQLVKLEKSHLMIENRQSTEFLTELLAEDFTEIGSSGSLVTREECLVDGVVLVEMELYDFQIRKISEDVWLTTYLVVDRTRKRNTRRSTIWRKEEGVFRMTFHQGTITSDQPV